MVKPAPNHGCLIYTPTRPWLLPRPSGSSQSAARRSRFRPRPPIQPPSSGLDIACTRDKAVIPSSLAAKFFVAAGGMNKKIRRELRESIK
jgi:hypothetical protein